MDEDIGFFGRWRRVIDIYILIVFVVEEFIFLREGFLEIFYFGILVF